VIAVSNRFEEYLMPEIRHRLDSEEQVQSVRDALQKTGVDWIMNERGEQA